MNSQNKIKNQTLSPSVLAIISLIIIYAVLFLWIDRPLAKLAQEIPADNIFYKISSHIARIFAPSHLFGLSIVIGLVGLFIVFGFKNKLKAKPYLLIGSAGIVAFLIAGILKILLARYRPIEFLDHGLYGFHFLSTKYEFNSTPSGHSTMIFAVLGSLAAVFKKHWLWIVLMLACLCVGLSRIIVDAHFLSDVVFGGYVGLLSVYWVRSFYA